MISSGSYTQISAGGVQNSYAIRSDGALFVWGWNGNYELGLGDTIARSSPVQLSSAGISYTLINTKTNNTTFFGGNGFILATGSNTAGMLGIGNTLNRYKFHYNN